MPLPADRRTLEWALRIGALAALAWLIAGAFRAPHRGGISAVPGSSLEERLPLWSRQPPADSTAIWFTTAPTASTRDWLRAIARGGTPIAWSDSGIPASMLDVEPRVDPAGGMLVRLAGPPGAVVRVGDALGTIDSVKLGARGTTLRLPEVSGLVTAAMTGATAAAAGGDTREHRHVVVLGRAGWEAKFITRALEERGWTVDARFILAPRLYTEQGKPFPLDTARHAAVIVVDSTAAPFLNMIASYLGDGGGVIVVGVPMGALGTLAAGKGRALVKAAAPLNGEEPRRALAFQDLAPLAEDAVPLETRDGHVAVAARRLGPGRIIQVGYQETWRWRMEGGPGAVAAHRAWWAQLVAGVAYRPAIPEGGDPAPLAALMFALGEPSSVVPRTPFVLRYELVLGVLVLCLLGEWTSRRLRGAA